MIREITITINPEDEKNYNKLKTLVFKELKQDGIKFTAEKTTLVFQKKSIDARHGRVKLHLRYKVYIDEKPAESEDAVPVWKKVSESKTVIIIGSGPAGLFAALRLLEDGIKPVIIERGTDTSSRRKDIALISTKNFVNANSNYCFGEGGAGTFSDGKLYTRSNKRGDIGRILRIFVHFGADKAILTDAHPHIGTDRLPKVINNMRNKIIELGGEFHFNTKLTDFIIEERKGAKTVCGIMAEDVISGEKTEFHGDAVILATGHSATDVYSLIARTSPTALEAKTFAVGVRVEHPRKLIDNIQYHGKTEGMPTAEYRVTVQEDERGVYSFCMCPGGFVVPSASGDEEIVVNGMSAAARNSKWSNAAIVVETRPEDIPQNFVGEAEKMGCPALAGLLFRTDLEKKAKMNGKGQAAPAQLLTDFLENRQSETLPETSYTPGITASNLNEWLPPHICTRLQKGFRDIDKKMHGFVSPEALLIAVETRTSTPVRILRDGETMECTVLKRLYPAGEGSGYAGGIVSSAMDGEKVANLIAFL